MASVDKMFMAISPFPAGFMTTFIEKAILKKCIPSMSGVCFYTQDNNMTKPNSAASC